MPDVPIPVPAQNTKLPRGGHRLYNLAMDPKQTQPIEEKETEARLLRAMGRLLAENDAPEAVYAAYGIPHPTE